MSNGIQLVQSNIKFNNWSKGSGSGATVIATNKTARDFVPTIENGSFIEDGTSAINAVEINWNGAEVAGQELNTTGEVLSEINTIENILINI